MVPGKKQAVALEAIPMSHFTERLTAHDPFALIRYGDGEIACMMGHEGENCDGHQYFEELGRDLIGTVKKQHERPFYYGLVRIATKEMPDEVAAISEAYQVPWFDSTVFADASRQGELYPFIEAIKQHRRVLYIGPAHLRGFFWQELGFWYTGRPGSGYHEIPQKNCYLKFEETLEHIASSVRLDRPTLLLFSAGMATNVLIYRLWYEFQDVTMIDIGSLFDGFVGVYSRKYMSEPKWQNLRRVNLYGHQHEAA